jgi:hypothetical protein
MHRHVKDATDTARQTYEQASRTGRMMQEEASTWWRTMMNTADWQKQVHSFIQIASSTVPLAQRNLEQMVELMEKNSRTSTELMKKAADALQAPLTGESQAAWMDFWTSTTKAAQTNAEGLMEFGTRAIDSWTEFVRRIAEVTPDTARAAR